MSTLSLQEAELPTAVDDFSALEERVVRAVELVKSERTARAQAEQQVARLQREAEEQAVKLHQTQEQVRSLEKEREQVRQRVERLLKQLDEVAS